MPKEEFLRTEQMPNTVEEVLDSKEKISVPEKKTEEKATPASLYSKEMDEEIKELKATKSFSVELAKTARGISEYQLPRIDSFLINLEKESPKDFFILEEKRKEIGKLIKKIFKWEQISRRRDFLKEAKENEKNRYKIPEGKTELQEKETIKIPNGHDIAA
jgi:hypothetical protein